MVSVVLVVLLRKYLELSGNYQLGCCQAVVVVHGNKHDDGQNNCIVRYQGSYLIRKINKMSSRIAIFYSGREEWRQFEFFQEERQEESPGEEEEGEEEDIRGVVAVLSQISAKPSKVKPGVSWVSP